MLNRTAQTSRVLALGGVTILAAVSLVACSGGESTASEDCTPAHEFETVNPGELTVASYAYPPLTVIDGDTLTGVEGDLLQQIADMECLTLVLDAAGGASASIPNVQSGRADLAAGSWNRTKERAEIVELGTPVVSDAWSVVSLDGTTVDELEGKKVGSVVGNLWNDQLQKWLGDDFSIYQDDESIYGDLEAGRIDVLIASTASAANRMDENPIEGVQLVEVTPNENAPVFDQFGQVNWPSNKDNPELRAAIDEDTETLREDGTIAEVLEQWGLEPSAAEPGDPFDL
ncbi:substrate-binding periplasmic protein [Leucobacter sp. GX24907]